LLVLAACCGWLHVAAADHSSAVTNGRGRPGIALIIDDLGNQREPGRRAIALPGPVACAFLPHGHFTRQLAQQAHARGKEVMLHLPMQSVAQERREPGELLLDMTQQQFTRTLQENIAAVPYLSGINNHRGSLITRHPGHMAWLMQAISRYGNLFFVDSRTTAATVARRLADEYRIPSSERKVFLDNERNPLAVREQFRRLLGLARSEGVALGIGHPYPETLAVLAEELARLGNYNIDLVPVSRLIEIETRNRAPWQAS
jgi:hypothetical protein